MPKAIPQGYHTVTPYLALKDSRRAIEFYKKAFGAKEKFIMAGPNGKGVVHAELMIGDSTIMLSDENPQMQCKGVESYGGSPANFYVYVENVDAACKQAVSAGAKTEMPVQDMFWGDRMGALKDPFGYKWTLATHVKDMTPEEISKAAERAFAHPVGK